MKNVLSAGSTVLALLVMAPLLYTLCTGDFPGARIFYGLQEDDFLSVLALDSHYGVIAIFANVFNNVVAVFN